MMVQAKKPETEIVPFYPVECIGCCGSYCRNQKLMKFQTPNGQWDLMGFKCMVEVADRMGWTLQDV